MCTTLCEDTEDLCSLLFLLEAPNRALDKLLHLCISSSSYRAYLLIPTRKYTALWKKVCVYVPCIASLQFGKWPVAITALQTNSRWKRRRPTC